MVDLILVHILVWSDGKLFLAERRNTAYGNGMYALPGGKREEMESPVEAVVREAEEELGIIIEKENAKFEAVTYFRESTDRAFLNFFFSCDKWRGHPLIKEEDKMSSLRLFSPHDLPENTLPFIRDAIEKILNGKKYVDHVSAL